MNKSNWVCLVCGMTSSRKYSVQRHTDKIHEGISSVVRFTEYIACRQTGVIPPPRWVARTVSPELKSWEPEKTRVLSTLDTNTAEFWKGFYREKGREAARKQIQGRSY